jgi:hypothetical protein
MAHASAWFDNNDMMVMLDAVKSSTMSASSYLNSSTGLSYQVWKATSTSSTANRLIAATNLPYVTGTNGRYRATVQSTAATITTTQRGMVIFTLSHSGLNGEWRLHWRGEYRRTT